MARGRIRIVSFNLRYSAAPDGNNIWQNRRPLVAEILMTYRPDVVGFQEVLLDQLRDLKRMLPDYRWVGVGREDGDQKGEFAPLFFHHLKAAETGNFWLSDTPAVPSKTWGGQNRICTWARLEGLHPFVVFNTHLESDVAEARARSVPLLAARVGELAGGLPALLIGDFNFKPNSWEYKEMFRDFRDSYKELKGSRNAFITSHGFSGRTRNPLWRRKGEGRIDYIWTRGKIRVLRTRILHDNPGENPRIYPSDHWPILCDVSFS